MDMDCVKVQPNNCFSPIDDRRLHYQELIIVESLNQITELVNELGPTQRFGQSWKRFYFVGRRQHDSWQVQNQRGKVKRKGGVKLREIWNRTQRRSPECQSMVHQLSTGNNPQCRSKSSTHITIYIYSYRVQRSVNHTKNVSPSCSQSVIPTRKRIITVISNINVLTKTMYSQDKK